MNYSPTCNCPTKTWGSVSNGQRFSVKYAYKVVNGKGRYSSGEIESESRDNVIHSLLSQGYSIVSLRVMKSKREINLWPGFSKVDNRSLMAATRQMAAMTGADMPLLQVLSVLERQKHKPVLGAAFMAVKRDISEGLALWKALQKHPGVFSNVYVNLVRAGEEGGILGQVLEELCLFLEREQKISSKVKSASIYPCFVAVFAVAVMVFLLIFIMPSFTNLFQASDLELPLPTRMVMSFSRFILENGLLVSAALIFSLILARIFSATRGGGMLLDRMSLRLPLIGRTITKLTTARFARTMGALLAAGIPLIPALEAAEGVAGNSVLGETIARARLNITRGGSISGPLEETGVFDSISIQMIAAGEMTGSLDKMMIKLAVYCDQEAHFAIDVLLATLEPLLIIIAASLVGFIVAATMLPIFQLSTTLN